MKEIYLDNSATTKVSEKAANTAFEVMTKYYGNPSSLHRKGIEAEQIMENARDKICSAMGGKNGHLYFTSGGTEGNNLALIGGALSKKRRGNKIVVSAYEHDSIMESAKYLEEEGFNVLYLLPDENGLITPDAIKNTVDKNTILVSIMTVNNEIGAINDIASLVKAAKTMNPDVLFHTDAVQAFGKTPVFADKWGVDLMTVTAHKINGPKGVGGLWIRKGIHIVSRQFGGEQENKMRPGTQAMPLIAAFGTASEDAFADLSNFMKKMDCLKERLIEGIKDVPGAVINSRQPSVGAISNISIPGIRSEILLHFLEEKGIYVSSGSACSLGAKSHVLRAMGYDESRVDSALRISMGRDNKEEDIDELVSALKEASKKLCR